MARREFTAKVRQAAYLRCGGKCEGKDCGVDLAGKRPEFDHIIPDALGGEATLENCQVLCNACHKLKTGKKDVPTIRKAIRLEIRHLGIIKPNKAKIPSRGFAKKGQKYSRAQGRMVTIGEPDD